MNFEVEVSTQGSTAVVSLRGECDLATAPRLESALEDAAKAGAREVILDMTNLAFMDSSGLRVIASGLERLRSAGGTLKVAGARGPSLKVLQLTGLDKVIPMYDDVSSASA